MARRRGGPFGANTDEVVCVSEVWDREREGGGGRASNNKENNYSEAWRKGKGKLRTWPSLVQGPSLGNLARGPRSPRVAYLVIDQSIDYIGMARPDAPTTFVSIVPEHNGTRNDTVAR